MRLLFFISLSIFIGCASLTSESNSRKPASIIDLQEVPEACMATVNRIFEQVSETAESCSTKARDFLMPIDDVFSISGRGTVVTGTILKGSISVGEEMEIVGLRATQKTKITGVEMFRKLIGTGKTGDNVGLLLQGIDHDEVERGQVIATPESIEAHDEFVAEASFFTKDEGATGRTYKVGDDLEFYFRNANVPGTILEVSNEGELKKVDEPLEQNNARPILPGDVVRIRLKLSKPIAMEFEQRFSLRLQGRTIGLGTVSEIVN